MIALLTTLVVLFCRSDNSRLEKLPDLSSRKMKPAPPWAQHGVVYQVFPRVFTPEGTFRALQDRLDYIRGLEVDIIWLMPIYPIGKRGRKGTVGSPFSVRNFRGINSDYGTEEDFRDLVRAIHRRGMKVIIGMVPNHAANDNVLMGEHPEWFARDEQGNFTREVADWSDVTDFNYRNPGLRHYMLETLKYWVGEFDIDGYRCDVAGMVPYDFWKIALPELRAIKSDLYLLAEWEDPRILLTGFNSDYDWTLYHLLKEIRAGKKRTADAIAWVEKKRNHYPVNSLPMRFLENHDEQRSLQVFGVEAIEAYATFLFTVPGIPLIYAGQEFGETKKPSLFEKSTLNWHKADTALTGMYRSLIDLRKDYSCFTNGTFKQLQTASVSGSPGAFFREDTESIALVVLNLRETTAEKVFITIPQEVRNRFKGITMVNYKDSGDTSTLDNMYISEMMPFETRVYVPEKFMN